MDEDERKMMTAVRPNLVLERNGDATRQTYKDANFSFSVDVTFDKPYEAKAGGDPPMFHNLVRYSLYLNALRA